jgi:hypothetical protein
MMETNMETKKDVRETLRGVLAEELDPYMSLNGFARRSNSLDYVRKCAAGEQLLQMHFTFKPTIDSRANAYIYPWIRLNFPDVNQVALEMVGGNTWLIGGDSDATFAQPMDFVVPKEAHVYWFTYGRDEDYVLCVRSIQGYIEKWIIPFLDEYSTINSVANYFERKDERIPAQRSFYIYVAAAYVLLKQPDKAMEVLESKFGKAGPRREYAKAFEYVESLIA